MGNIYLNGEQYGGGGSGGGNSITYGYTNPVSAGNDGDLYYLLDTNDKQFGLFLYFSDAWHLIEGRAIVPEYVLYDNGTEDVSWTVSGGTKNNDSISINTGSGNVTNYCVTDNAIDLTDYSVLHIECHYRSQNYDRDIDISNVTGSKYISFTYLSDNSHNECAVGLADTKTSAITYRIDSRDGGDNQQALYYMSLS